MSVLPLPQGRSEFVDLDGNNLTKIWFADATQQLMIQTSAKVETSCQNPFNYMLEPWAIALPFDYPSSLLSQLKPYLQPHGFVGDSSALVLGQEILVATQGKTLDFLFNLNQRIYQDCEYIIRETGEPLPPGITWRDRKGSCRDFVVFFMEVCRTMGIAARFVSGYQEGDAQQESRDLHAWVEVYLPGAGWRGYDPTLGLVVSDRHIPLVASAISSYTLAVCGKVNPVKEGEKVISNLESQIAISAFSSK